MLSGHCSVAHFSIPSTLMARLRETWTSDTRAFFSTSFRISFHVAKPADSYLQPFLRKISQLPEDVHTKVIEDQMLIAFETPSYVALSLYLCVHDFFHFFIVLSVVSYHIFFSCCLVVSWFFKDCLSCFTRQRRVFDEDNSRKVEARKKIGPRFTRLSW